MVGRRKKPDGLPFRLYMRVGKRITSFGYKDDSGKWLFRLKAPTAKPEEVAAVRAQAIQKADEINCVGVKKGTVSALIKRYFAWQYGLPIWHELRKAESTLKENERESQWLDKVFGAMLPVSVMPHHVYGYLDRRGKKAPSKANKEIALFSAIMEYGRRLGEVVDNPCHGISYIPIEPKTKLVDRADIDFVLNEGRRRGGVYLVEALCALAAYLAVARPEEIRQLHRNAVTPEGLKIPIGKRKAGKARKYKLADWTPALREVIEEAISLQRTPSVYIFANTRGQPYNRNTWSNNWRRLMAYCEERAKRDERPFTRFALTDMRPTAVTKRMDAGDAKIIDATGHADGKMVNRIYDRRSVKRFDPTE